MTPTTPVLPIPSCTSMPHSRSSFATTDAVRLSSYASSGWRCRSRRTSRMSAASSLMRARRGEGCVGTGLLGLISGKIVVARGGPCSGQSIKERAGSHGSHYSRSSGACSGPPPRRPRPICSSVRRQNGCNPGPAAGGRRHAGGRQGPAVPISRSRSPGSCGGLMSGGGLVLRDAPHRAPRSALCSVSGRASARCRR